MTELVDVADSKSAVGDYVWVRIPFPAFNQNRKKWEHRN